MSDKTIIKTEIKRIICRHFRDGIYYCTANCSIYITLQNNRHPDITKLQIQNSTRKKMINLDQLLHDLIHLIQINPTGTGNNIIVQTNTVRHINKYHRKTNVQTPNEPHVQIVCEETMLPTRFVVVRQLPEFPEENEPV